MSDTVHKAIKFALKAHKSQNRDGAFPLPYLTHPIDVVNRLRYVGGITDESVLVAGILHDVLEETERTAEDIFEKFGGRVLDLVLEVTRTEPEYGDRVLSQEELWHLRTQMLLVEIEAMSPDAMVIKLADRASNLTSGLVTREGDAMARYLKQSKWVLEKIPRETNPALWDSVETLIAKA